MSDAKPKCGECGKELEGDSLSNPHTPLDCITHLKARVKELEPIPFPPSPAINFAPSLGFVTTSGWSYDRSRRIWEWRVRLEGSFAIADYVLDSYHMSPEEVEHEVEEQLRRGLINTAKGPLSLHKRMG